ncbi:hypothetical protein EVAR_103284_1 [Eumeta japonica]|uniref:Uncharacterized protein n=1 Tax=Eumeta variegata TaxID=151549 RepID=A0A4C1XQZ7_EUMVA|nr:hypothetical protein EVAR_103284_1 [Eumeta japonica]
MKQKLKSLDSKSFALIQCELESAKEHCHQYNDNIQDKRLKVVLVRFIGKRTPYQKYRVNYNNTYLRVFWLVFVTLSWYGSSLLIRAQYDAFQNNPISFVVETTYKDWDTHFPSVAVCENDNTERIEEKSDE